MKLIIQIPCFNEEAALPATLAALPRAVAGCDQVEWLVIDDGSTDGTAAVARANGVDHVVVLPRNRGLAHAFTTGLEACLARGADVIVNTDADNQYCADDIPLLVGPILRGEADLVVGERPISDIAHFSPIKKLLQRLGSAVVRVLSRTDVRDAPSGFRALSREAAFKLNVFSEYTYTLETLIQAGQKSMAVVSVPIRVNGETRPSRLVAGLGSYVQRSVVTMVRIFITYRPLRFFMTTGLAVFLAGFALGLRFLYYYATGAGEGKIQSTILAALLMGTGAFLCVMGLVVDLIAVNRQLLEKLQWRLARLEARGPAPEASPPRESD
ncbi:MAG: glycosyltransferase family 2 protein [Candidatus Krumholzibacteriia bacterium]